MKFLKNRKTFFAYIQTSDNHRPYMIPETDTAILKSLYRMMN